MNAILRSAGAVLVLAALAGCAPREWLLPRLGMKPPALRDFPPGYTPPVSFETNQPMPGFGGAGEVQRTPVIFIHGNTVSARYWLPAREHFRKAGYADAELWSLGYGWDNVRYFDSNDLSVPSVERIVTSVMAFLSKQGGRPIRQVDIIGHSLGVTLVRQWLKQTNSYHKVRNFIGACGANDGVWTAWSDTRGQQRGVSWEVFPGSPWLAQLNRGGEVPGPTRYMTLYDGTGWADVLFPKPSEHSGALKGAYNLAYNAEHGTWYDHLELPRVPETMDAMIAFLRQAREPLPQEKPPNLVRTANRIATDQADARVHCAANGIYPAATTRGLPDVALPPGALLTCFARNPRTQLASPLARYKGPVPDDPQRLERPTAIVLTAAPPGGVYEHAQSVELEVNDPDAFIVYTTSGTKPNSGSPLYQEPVYVSGPLTLWAMAITPDGRQSAPLRLDYDISLELVEARHTLQRQYDAAAPVNYEGRRGKGR